jgi:hypothetical protein
LRTTQYACILAVQVVMLCAMFAFGIQIVPSPDLAVPTNTADVGQPPSGQGFDDLRQYLSR